MDHSHINLYTSIAWLLKNAKAFAKHHPFFCSSLAIHGVVLYVLYAYGSYTIDVQLHQQATIDVTQSVQRARQTDMQQRVDGMEKIKRLLEKSLKDSSVDDIDKTPENTSVPKSPQELLAKARETSQAIKKLEKNIKAEELAKLLNIPKEEALKKVEEKISSEPSKKAAQDDVQSVKQLEAEARTVLEQRKKDLDAKREGTKVDLSQVSASTTQDKNAGNGNKTSAGKGEGERGNNHGLGRGSFESSQATGSDGENNSATLHEMEDFLAESSYLMDGENNFFDPSRGHIPAVSGSERKQSGRIIGSGGAFVERFYLNSWYVIGPFKGNSNAALYNNPAYPPEQLVDLDAIYFGKDERVLKWQYVSRGEYPFVPPDRAEDAVYYGYTEVAMEREQDLWMWCGADDDLQVWLNQHLVWAGGNIAKQNFFDTIYPGTNNYRKNWNLTEGKRLVHFKQGTNTLLFKLSNGPNRVGIFASIVLTQ